MATKVGDIMAPNGTYTKDGQEKTRWLRCGTMLKTDNGIRIKIDAMPVETDGWFSVFEDKPKTESRPQQKPLGDDHPF